MDRSSRDWAALMAAFMLIGCGGASDGNGTGTGSTPTTSAPAPSPSASPSPSPSPSPAPSPAPTPTPAPSPAPAPAPSAQLTRGATLYRANCSGCHGNDPETGTQGIYKGVTPEIINAAYRRVDAMNIFAMLLSSADTTDVAAFIKSRVGP